jgi:hypothetical protein
MAANAMAATALDHASAPKADTRGASFDHLVGAVLWTDNPLEDFNGSLNLDSKRRRKLAFLAGAIKLIVVGKMPLHC